MGKFLHEVMSWDGPPTHRQVLAWAAWKSEQLNQPSLTDYYLMQVACELRRSRAKHPEQVKLEDFKLKFTRRSQELTEEAKKKRAAMSKQIWMGLAGVRSQDVEKLAPGESVQLKPELPTAPAEEDAKTMIPAGKNRPPKPGGLEDRIDMHQRKSQR